MDKLLAELHLELRRTNAERNLLRRGMQIIVDLKAGGEAERIARQILGEIGEIRSSNPERPIPDIVYPPGPASLFASYARENRTDRKKILGEI